MNIIEVMNSLQIEVGYARRPCWGEGVILVRQNISDITIINVNEPEYPNYFLSHKSEYDFSRDDLLADDWIVVDGK